MQTKYTPNDVIRFWGKVKKTENPSDCWIWTACKEVDGYGVIYWGVRGKHERASRIVWILTFGEIPEGMIVCHKCDNPSCCNPNHLFLGTRKDNHDDMVSKGRRASFHGENNGRSKLNRDNVSEIRYRYTELHERAVDLARLYGVHRSTIWKIVSKNMW